MKHIINLLFFTTLLLSNSATFAGDRFSFNAKALNAYVLQVGFKACSGFVTQGSVNYQATDKIKLTAWTSHGDEDGCREDDYLVTRDIEYSVGPFHINSATAGVYTNIPGVGSVYTFETVGSFAEDRCAFAVNLLKHSGGGNGIINQIGCNYGRFNSTVYFGIEPVLDDDFLNVTGGYNLWSNDDVSVDAKLHMPDEGSSSLVLSIGTSF